MFYFKIEVLYIKDLSGLLLIYVIFEWFKFIIKKNKDLFFLVSKLIIYKYGIVF